METLINICRWIIKSARSILVALLVICLVVPATIYVMLSTDWAQRRLRISGEITLEKLLGVDVEIGDVRLRPFSRLSLYDVVIHDDYGRQALSLKQVEARIELVDFLMQRGLIIDYATINGLDARVYRPTPESPLNIDGIIRNLTTDKPKSEAKHFMMRLNTVEILNSSVAYDVYGTGLTPMHFDPNHLALSEVNAVIHAPIVSTDAYGVRLRRLSFVERSGFRVNDISGDFSLSNDSLLIRGLNLEMPRSALRFADISAAIDTIADVPLIGTRYPLSIGINEGSHISPSDFRAFDPRLGELSADVHLTLQAHGTLDSLCVESMSVYDNIDGLDIKADGCAKGLSSPADAVLSGFEAEVQVNCASLLSNLSKAHVRLSPRLRSILLNAGAAYARASIDGGVKGLDFGVDLHSDLLQAHIDGTAAYDNGMLRYDAALDLAEARLGLLLDNPDLGSATAKLESAANIRTNALKSRRKPLRWSDLGEAKARIEVERLEYKGHAYAGIEISADADREGARASLTSTAPDAEFGLFAEAVDAGDGLTAAVVHANISRISPPALGLTRELGANSISAQIDADALWRSPAEFKASAHISDLAFADTTGRTLYIGDFTASADNLTPGLNSIEIESDYINGALRGKYDLATLAPDIMHTLAGAMPILAPANGDASIEPTLMAEAGGNAFDFDFTIDNAHEVCDFFRLPVYLDDPVRITGDYDRDASMANLDIDAPIFINGNKLVRNTIVHTHIDGGARRSDTYLTSLMPTKKGDMQIEAVIEGIDGVLSTKVDWEILREKPINGQLNLNTSFSRDEGGSVTTRVGLRHSTINFGDAVWTIMPNANDFHAADGQSASIVAGKVESVIEYNGHDLKVSDFVMQTSKGGQASAQGLASAGQSIRINGMASASPDDHLVVEMDNIQMLHIFETLDIDKALICGSATGTVDVSALFSKTPQIKSTRFNVNGIGYNGCVLGDADVKLGFNAERGSFDFLTDIVSAEGRRSVIDGWITPANEGISLKFDADRVKVGFMKPFVSAFCSDIDGYASGKAELFGTFKYINMRGDLLAQDLRMKIEYTNTWYSTTDSLHLTPGLIELNDITLHDGRGGSATLNGRVTHQYFKRAGFDFDIRVNPGKPMLCYNIPQSDNPDQRWYGEIYGRDPSHVRVHGIPGDDRTPGHVDINIYATTAPKSVFTFELSDLMVAQDYTFLTFRDVTPKKAYDQYLESPTISKSEIWAEKHRNIDSGDLPTEYRIDITANVTPQAKAILVMDPVGRDAIEAYGAGLLNLVYDSADEDLAMRGTYTLEHGSYQFTLQDLIFRNFKIDAGSRIIFDGDPYECQLDITAQYTLKANLSDLDESFLTDKDLNSTKVDVAAILKVGGQINDLSIKFDLAFPHLNQDIYRKVRSIISTDEMMSRQIVYLMTLNRFYTPEYMSTTKGNELFSVASSTISAQLSNALGKLSDNWTISPNVRSDRGDFSDVEVDLQLSSALLDNKLLFNGNFGYRDKSLNTNQFVGDFDIEYLLNPSGSLRLRAYNRYNDQNYYLRTAQTTQGVGIVVKHDFDTFSGLFKGFFRRPRRLPDIVIPSPDSLITPPDTLLQKVDSLLLAPADTIQQ